MDPKIGAFGMISDGDQEQGERERENNNLNLYNIGKMVILKHRETNPPNFG